MEINRQVLEDAQNAGHTTAERGALDGTLVAAHASRHRLLSESTLAQRCQQLDQVSAIEVSATTSAERPKWMATTPQRQRYRQAQERMEQLQQRNRQKRAYKRVRPEQIVVSVSDPHAALGLDKERVYRPLYNVQLIDDLDSPYILAYDVFPHLAVAEPAGVTLYGPWQQNDYTARRDQPPRQIPKKEFQWLVQEQTYACPQGHRLELIRQGRQKYSSIETTLVAQYRCPPQYCLACPLQPNCTKNATAGRMITRGEHDDLIETLRARMATDEAKKLYRLRRQTVELVNADMKEHRKLRRFSGHGLTRAKTEIGLLMLSHNLLTLAKYKKIAHLTAAIPEKIAA
jgi:hypothetical protein